MAELTRDEIEYYRNCEARTDFERMLCDLALRALSAPAPQQTASEQQELIATLREVATPTVPEVDVEDGALAKLLLKAASTIEALSRSHEDGRRAGLEEAARQCTYEKLDVADTKDKVDYVYNRACDDCRTAIRALKTQKGGA